MYNYKGKTLLIIGAGFLQLPAIETAKKIGLTTVVTDYNEKAPGMAIADYPVVASTRDSEGTVRIMKEFTREHKIDGVITVGTDASMTVAAVANALNLPGIKFEDAEAASNKIKMRERLKQHNVPIPEFRKCWSFGELQDSARELGYPLVIKPTDNMGARGVMKIENEQSLEYVFQNAKNASPSGELIVEEYMKGSELSIDALVFDGTIHITGIADRIIEREPYFIEIGHVMPSALPQEVIDNAVDVFKQGIRALGITIGAAKGDIKITGEGAKVGEIAARLSGGFMSAYTYPYATGVNLIHNAIDIALGHPPHNLKPKKDFVSIEKAIIPPPGIIKNIAGVEEAYAINGLKHIFLHRQKGDIVEEPHSNVDKPANFIVVRETREEAWNTAREVEKVFKIVTDSGQKPTWQQIKKQARDRYNNACIVCDDCNGIACKGQLPGMGGIGNGEAFIRNVRDLSNYMITTRVIHDVTEVKTQIKFLGAGLTLPVLIAPITGCDINLGGLIAEQDYDDAVVKGAKNSGILAFVGDGAQPSLYKIGLDAVKKVRGWGGAIFKPRENMDDIITRLEAAQKIGARFIGVDVDAGVGFVTMGLLGQKVSVKSVSDLKKLTSAVDLPFIVKGVMCTEDAEAAIEAGAECIVVSNHGGRVLQSHPSAVSVLEKISRAVDNRIKVVLDGGIRSGEDIFKALALGADAVMIGRPYATAVLGAGAEGVEVLTEKYRQELEKVMLLTGTKDIKSISKERLVHKE